jgi:hypothetical protein
MNYPSRSPRPAAHFYDTTRTLPLPFGKMTVCSSGIIFPFPLPSTAYDFLDTTVGVATILRLWSFIVDTVLSLLLSSGIHNSLRLTQPLKDCPFPAQNNRELLQCDELYSG